MMSQGNRGNFPHYMLCRDFLFLPDKTGTQLLVRKPGTENRAFFAFLGSPVLCVERENLSIDFHYD